MSIIIDGNKIAQDIRQAVREETLVLTRRTGIVPGLAVVLAGDDPASKVYVGRKAKAYAEAGFLSREYKLPADTNEAELLALIRDLNNDRQIHGILVQLPLPKHISTDRIIAAIDPKKDVDGFHPANVGRLVTSSPLFIPCTPRGIMELIARTGIELSGKDGCDRAQQHRRQAHGVSASGAKRHGDDVPFQNEGPARRGKTRRCPDCRHRKAAHDHCGHGERGCRGD